MYKPVYQPIHDTHSSNLFPMSGRALTLILAMIFVRDLDFQGNGTEPPLLAAGAPGFGRVRVLLLYPQISLDRLLFNNLTTKERIQESTLYSPEKRRSLVKTPT